MPALHAVEAAEHDGGVGEHEGEPAQHAQGVELHGFGGLVPVADGEEILVTVGLILIVTES